MKSDEAVTAETGFQDIDGNPVTLDKLCRIEPAWAANVIRTLRAERDAAVAECERLRALAAGPPEPPAKR